MFDISFELSNLLMNLNCEPVWDFIITTKVGNGNSMATVAQRVERCLKN